MSQQPSPRLAGLVLLLAVLGCAAVASAPPGTHIGGAWPIGLASGLLVFGGRRLLPWTVCTVLLVTAASYALGGYPLAVVPAVAVAVCVEALVTLVVLESRWGRGTRLWEDADLARFTVAAVLGAATGAVLFAGASAAFGYGVPAEVLVATFVSHLVSQVVLLPFFMEHSTHAGDGGRLERTLRWTVTVLVTLVAFVPHHLPALVFLVIPVVGWGALRAPMREALWQLLTVATLSNALHYWGLGPFHGGTPFGDRSPELGGLPQQAFVLGCALVCIPFAMAVARQKRATGEIARERARLARIVESATGTALIETDAIGRITLFNPGAEALLGYAESEVLGRFPDLFHSQEEIAKQAAILGTPPDLMHVSLALARPENGQRDWTYTRKDGSTCLASVRLVPIHDQGTVVGYLCTAEDITERALAQQALEKALATERRAVAQLTEIDRTKDAFVSSVSHELRTPITSIVGFLELLQDGAYGETTDRQHEALGRIDTNSRRLLELIDDLLTLSSIESMDVELARRPVDLRDIVRRTGQNVHDDLSERHQHLDVVVPSEPVLVLGDDAHLERMVANLASNAVKFTPDGGTVTLRAHYESDVGVIEVQDTGVGIPDEEQQLLFNRFFRSSYAQSEAIKGSGLGLSIARSIAHLHGARISAVSRPGQGSVFRVAFDGSQRSTLQPL